MSVPTDFLTGYNDLGGNSVEEWAVSAQIWKKKKKKKPPQSLHRNVRQVSFRQLLLVVDDVPDFG